MLHTLALTLFAAQRKGPLLQDGPDLTWLMGVVGMLVLSIAGLAFGFRKVVLGSIKTRAARRDLAILDVLPLGGKRQLAVVRCYDRTFALGLGEKSVDLVAELDHEAVHVDREKRASDEEPAFQARLLAAKERLLGAQDMIPGLRRQTPSAPRVGDAKPGPPIELGEVEPRSGSEREFVA